MKKRLEILVEETSMEVFLRGILPRVLPYNYKLDQNCFVYPHEGKSDLQKRLPKRVQAYKYYPQEVVLVVIHDQDSWDCKKLKENLIKLVKGANPEIPYLIRIACRELENWYLGDLDAVQGLYPDSKASRMKNKAKYRHVDNLHGSNEMERMSDNFMKTDCARKIAGIIDIDTNSSRSFMNFICGLKSLLS